MPERGIFAQRAKHRSNPIGLAVVRLIGVDEAVPRVQGLDAINGSPVLDLKPYLPDFDSPLNAQVPAWVAGYFQG